MNEVFCRPKWYGVDFPPLSSSELTKFKVIKILKDSPEAREIFRQKYLDDLPEDYVWKILTNRESVYRSNADFIEEFNILE
jgi:hypothetical protein